MPKGTFSQYSFIVKAHVFCQNAQITRIQHLQQLIILSTFPFCSFLVTKYSVDIQYIDFIYHVTYLINTTSYVLIFPLCPQIHENIKTSMLQRRKVSARKKSDLHDKHKECAFEKIVY